MIVITRKWYCCCSVIKSFQLVATPMDYCTPGSSILHYPPEFSQIHAHWVSDVIQPFHLQSHPSFFAFTLSQHQALFQWVSSLHQVDKVLELQLQHQSFFTTRHIHNWASFLLWPSHFILSRATRNCSPFFPSIILDTFWPRGSIIQRHILLLFHTSHEVLAARILE